MKNIISNEHMREADKHTISNYIPSKQLMWNAALGVFAAVDWKGEIAIVTGKGNNAGDGFALSLILKEHNITSTIVMIEEPKSEDAIFYFKKAIDEKIKIKRIKETNLYQFDIIVDAIFGTGFIGEIKEEYKSAIEKINESDSYVVSIDINSGINGDSGMGITYVKSDITIAIGQYKYGHFLNMAKDVMKELRLASIGIEPLYRDALLLEENDVKDFFIPRNNFSNKGNYGYVGIIGGSSKYPGAPRLASLGQNALYAGAGVSKLIVPDSIASILYPLVLETTICPLSSRDGNMVFNQNEIDEAINHLKVLSCGVGWGVNEENERILSYLLNNIDIPFIIDADGLNVLSKIGLDILNTTKAKVILTPHIKEFSRLSGLNIYEILDNPMKVVKEFVDKYNVVLLLKGPSTIIASKDNIYIVNRGTPGMAKAGSGDVLTGILTGILGENSIDITKSVAVGAFINGYSGELAAKEFSVHSMVASDTARNVSIAIKELLRN